LVGVGGGWIPNLSDNKFKVSSPYGTRTHPTTGEKNKMHNGVDFAMPVGTALSSTISGVVIHAGYTDGGFGNYVAVKGQGGDVHIFGHLDSVSVKAGQTIQAGALIGKSGNTGRSSGPHLHYEVRKGSISGQAVDPMQYLNKVQGPPQASPSSSGSGSGGGGKALSNVPNQQVMGYISSSSKKHGVNSSLIAAIMQTESNFKTNVTSSAGAYGLMQLIPVHRNGSNNPSTNVDIGVSYIKQQLKKYPDMRLALAAYNAGPGNVDKAIKKAGSNDWEKVKQYLPKETQNYIPKVLGLL